MSRPLYFCSGLKRSGSTWSYNVSRLLLQRKLKSMVCGYVGEKEAVENYLTTLQPDTPALMKFHYASDWAFEQVRSGAAKNVYTARHPIMALASEMDFFKQQFDVAVSNIYAGLQMMDRWKAMPGTLIIHFQDLCSDPLAQIAKIATHFDCEQPPEVYQAIDDETSFESSKKLSEDVSRRPDSEVAAAANIRWDRLTLIHGGGHASQGLERKWEKTLSPAQIDKAKEVFAQWLPQFAD